MIRSGLAVFLVALTVRIGWLASIHHRLFFTALQTEPARYDAWSAAILTGEAPLRPPFDEAPGYPLFLAATKILIGRTPGWECGVQAVLDAISCALIAYVATRSGSVRAGWIAGLLAAAYRPMVYFTGQLEPATLVVLAVAAGLAATPSEGERGWGRAGGVWALGLFARSELVLAWPFVVAHAAAVGGRRAAARVAVAPIAVLAAVLAVNAASTGRLVGPTTGAGVNLWIGDGAGADGVDPFLTGARADVMDRVDATDPVDLDRRMVARTIADVRADPEGTARVVVRRAAWSWSARELPNAADIEWQEAQSPLSPALVGFGVLFPLACAGVVLAWPDRRRLGVLVGPIAVGAAVQVLFLANARFRMPMAPSLAVFAGLGVDRAFRAGPRARAAAAGAAVLAAVLAWSDLGGVWAYRIPALDLVTAGLELGAGDFDPGFARMEAAVHAAPEDPLAWVQLAGSLEQVGRVEEAGAAWSEAEEALPDDPRIAGAAAAFRRRHR